MNVKVCGTCMTYRYGIALNFFLVDRTWYNFDTSLYNTEPHPQCFVVIDNEKTELVFKFRENPRKMIKLVISL